MSKENFLPLKKYLIFIVFTVILGLIACLCFIFFISNVNEKSNIELSKKEAGNIEKIISESFEYSNKINSYVGQKILEGDVNDLKFILKIFRQAEELKNKNSQLLSWSSFDFVDKNNFQRVNSRLGIRKDPPEMSARQYCKTAKEKPWTLQLSFPVFGNPSNSWVIPAGTGIADKNNNFAGIVVVGFNIAELSLLVEKRLIGQSSFLVLDEDLNIVINSRDLENSKEEIAKKINKLALQEEFGSFKNELLINGVKFFYYKKFNNYPYFVLTGFETTSLQNNLYNAILPTTTIIALISFLFSLILILFKNKIFELTKIKSLHQANISKTKLIRATSHDLRNYIFGISGLSRLILDNKSETEIAENEDLKMIQELYQQSEEMMGFVEDLLDTSQNEDGEFNVGKKQICNIVDLANRMVILNRNFALENNINLEFDNKSPYQEISVNCDIRRIKQVLNNIIGNSIKYTNANNIVLVQISIIENEVCIAVIDQGIGMSKKEINMALSGDGEKIKKVGLNKSSDSHGLGVPIIKKLIELHKGRIEINSQKGVGSEFRIYLAIYDDSKKSPKSQSHLSERFKNKSVLIAEDNAITNKVVTFLLRKMGFYVKHVENGEEILQSLEKQHFDLIVLDINMPKLNGLQTSKTIREGKIFSRFKNFQIPIIAISADKQELSDLRQHGINLLLGKPFSEKELLDFVLQCVKKD